LSLLAKKFPSCTLKFKYFLNFLNTHGQRCELQNLGPDLQSFCKWVNLTLIESTKTAKRKLVNRIAQE
jgi:hypothetical protein